MTLSDIIPLKTPLLVWHPDCMSGLTAEAQSQLETEHLGIVSFMETLVSHNSADVIPIFDSVSRLCIGNKKDTITLFYSFQLGQISIEYQVNDKPQKLPSKLTYQGKPENAIELIKELLDFFVSRHKRL